MRKSLLLALLALAAFPAMAGSTFQVGGVTYEVTGDETVAVSDVDNSITSFVIPETVSDGSSVYTVTSIGEDAFYWSNAVNVTLPNTVTEIGYGAFRSSDLATINMGTGVTSIGDWAFAYTKLTSIDIPEGVTSIGNSAFASCTYMASVTFPESLRTLGNSVFYHNALASVTLPAGLESVGAKVFLSNQNLTEINLPAGLKMIGDGMFQDCKNLTSIALPEGLERIGGDAFLESGIVTIEIPATVSEIGFSAFATLSLEQITVAEGNESFVVDGGVLYNADHSLLYAYPAKSSVTEVNVHPDCIGICEAAFWRSNVTKVTLGSQMRAIDQYAFCFSSGLTEINMPASLVYIGTEAFASTGLVNVVLPPALPELRDAVFAGCSSLASIDLPATLNYIDIRAFWNCTSLQTVNCHATVPPVLEEIYEDYEDQFFNVPSTCKLHVPSNAVNAYRNSDWAYTFSNTNIIGDLASTIRPTGFSPEQDAVVSSFEGVTITFSETISIAQSTPSISVICGHLTAGVPVGEAVDVDAWGLVRNSDTKSALLFPMDYDGYTNPFYMESGKDYFIIIPAGTFKNESGDLSEEIMIHYEGGYEKPVVEYLTVSPSTDSFIGQLDNLAFTFAQPVTLVTSKLPYIVAQFVSCDSEGNPDSGSTLPTPEDEWMGVYGKTSGTEIQIFPSDYDGFVVPLVIPANHMLKISIPEGLFRLQSSYTTVNDEFELWYSTTVTGVGMLNSENSDVEIYTLQGHRVAAMEPGQVYIVVRNGKSTKMLKQ